ncbi:MAG: hypothetical protein IPP77_14915 [Bacteroidetes bacterium]|nr:hypothetical protein [Bacteroidota bacterium]
MNQSLLFLRYFLFLLFFAQGPFLKAQDEPKKPKKERRFESSSAVLIAPSYTAQFPFGDMKTRFGFNSLIGLHLSYKTANNWLVGGEVGVLVGARVKESYLLDNISTSSGQHVTLFNDLTNVKPNEIGYNVKFVAGKIVPLSKKFPDAGLLFMTSIGFLEHKILFNVRRTELPQLDKTYRTGYDRLSNGPVVSQFIGGIYMERKKFISVYGGLQFDLGFTQGRRPYDFYLQKPLNDKRMDMFIGIKFGWIIPIFLQASDKEYYFD